MKTYDEFMSAATNRGVESGLSQEEARRVAEQMAVDAVRREWVLPAEKDTGLPLATVFAGGGEAPDTFRLAKRTREGLAHDRAEKRRDASLESVPEVVSGMDDPKHLANSYMTPEISMISAPVPREGWDPGYGPETAEVGTAPGKFSLGSVSGAAGTATIDWGDGGTQSVRVGDRLERYPSHEVTDLTRVYRKDDPRLYDWAIEVTPPYESGQGPYYIYHGDRANPDSEDGPFDFDELELLKQDLLGKMKFAPIPVSNLMMSMAMADMLVPGAEMKLPGLFLEEQAEDEAEARRRVKAMQDEVNGAAEENGWDMPTTNAFHEAMLGSSDMRNGEKMTLVGTSPEHENGSPVHVYVQDEDGVVWEYTEQGPYGKPELVRADSEKG